MKILFENYSFNAASKQITLNSPEEISLERLLIITNVTDNIIIYNFADPNKGGNIVNNVLTLDFDTVLMSDTDKLQIFLENVYTPASEETLQHLNDQTILLRRMVKLLEPSSVQDAAGRQRINITAIEPRVLVDNFFTYFGNLNFTIATQESAFVLQSRIAYATLRQNMEFS